MLDDAIEYLMTLKLQIQVNFKSFSSYQIAFVRPCVRQSYIKPSVRYDADDVNGCWILYTFYDAT